MIYHLGRGLVGPLARAVYRPTIEGAAHVPTEGGVVLASNHLSFIDSFVIPLASPRKVHFLAKKEYFVGTGLSGRIRKGFFESVGALPVDRESARAAQESLDIGVQVLRAGDAFGIYPEGTRSRDGRLYRGRTGVAWLALTAGVPIVPVGLIGTGQVQPVGARWPRIAPVTVRFGEPIAAQAYAGLPAARGRRALTDAVMDAIGALTGQERADGHHVMGADGTP